MWNVECYFSSLQRNGRSQIERGGVGRAAAAAAAQNLLEDAMVEAVQLIPGFWRYAAAGHVELFQAQQLPERFVVSQSPVGSRESGAVG